MSESIKVAVKMIEGGHVRVGVDMIQAPAFTYSVCSHLKQLSKLLEAR